MLVLGIRSGKARKEVDGMGVCVCVCAAAVQKIKKI
jgi:hypothetical protein